MSELNLASRKGGCVGQKFNLTTRLKGQCWKPGGLIFAEGEHARSVALGWPGGMQRSGVLAEGTARTLRSLGYQVAVRHRDISRDQEWM